MAANDKEVDQAYVSLHADASALPREVSEARDKEQAKLDSDHLTTTIGATLSDEQMARVEALLDELARDRTSQIEVHLNRHSLENFAQDIGDALALPDLHQAMYDDLNFDALGHEIEAKFGDIASNIGTELERGLSRVHLGGTFDHLFDDADPHKAFSGFADKLRVEAEAAAAKTAESMKKFWDTQGGLLPDDTSIEHDATRFVKSFNRELDKRAKDLDFKKFSHDITERVHGLFGDVATEAEMGAQMMAQRVAKVLRGIPGNGVFDAVRSNLSRLGRLVTESLASLGEAIVDSPIWSVVIALLPTAIVALSSVFEILVGLIQGSIALLPILAGAAVVAAAGLGVLYVAFKNMPQPVKDSVTELKNLKNTIADKFWASAQQPFIDMINKLLPTLQTLVGTISTSVGNFMGKVFTAAGESQPFKDALAGIGTSIGHVFDNLSPQPIIDAFTNLSNLISTVVDLAAPHLDNLNQKIANGIGKLVDWLKDPANQEKLGQWFEKGKEAASQLWQTTVNILSIFDSIHHALDQSDIKMSDITTATGTIANIFKDPEFQKAMAFFFDLMKFLAKLSLDQLIQDFLYIQGLVIGLTAAWHGLQTAWEASKSWWDNTFVPWWDSLWGRHGHISHWWYDFTDDVNLWITDFPKALANSAQQGSLGIAFAFGALPAIIEKAFARIVEAGAIAWARLTAGASGGIAQVVSFFAGLPGQIAGVLLGPAGTVLWNVGWNLIKGLVNGIEAAANSILVDALHWVTSLFPLHKGPPAKDAVLLFDTGQLIIEGLINGLESRYGAVRRSLSGLTSEIGSTQMALPGASIAAGGLSGVAAQVAAATASATVRTFIYNNYGSSGLSSEEELFAAAGRSRMAW